jgi:PAS domain S-box-containing protein
MKTKENVARALVRALVSHNLAPTAGVLLEDTKKRPIEVLQAIPWGLLSEDRRGKLNFYNQQARTIFGYSEKEALGMPSINLAPEELREGREKLFREVLEGEAARYVGTQRLTKSGQRVTIYGYVFPYEMQKGAHSIAALVRRS